MRSWTIIMLGCAVSLGTAFPLEAASRPAKSPVGKRCDALTSQLRTEFMSYRTSRASSRTAIGHAYGYLNVGITILPRGAKAAASSQSSAFKTFRRKQFAIVAQMRSAGC